MAGIAFLSTVAGGLTAFTESRHQGTWPHVTDSRQFAFQLVPFQQESIEIGMRRHCVYLTAVYAVR